MSWDLLFPALGGGLGVILLIGWAQRAPDTKSCSFGLIPLTILGLGSVLCTFIAFTLFYHNDPNDNFNDEIWLKPAFIIGGIIFSAFFLDSLKRKIIWNDAGLTAKRLFGKDIRIDWENTLKLEYSNWAQWWKLNFKDGNSIVFYDMMRGSNHLIKECEIRGIEIHS